MKRIIIEDKDKSEQTQNQNEINVFTRLNHKNIIKYYDNFIHKGKLCIVMEYAEKGDLTRIIKEHKKKQKNIEENEIWYYILQILQGVKYMHHQKVVHRDIKCQNIFICKDNIVKLGDFGISKILKKTIDFCKTPIGTPYFLSPEICAGKQYNNKVDIWMVGCVLYELLYLNKPFQGNNLPSIISSIITKDINIIPNNYSDNLKQLLILMLNKDPNKRPDINDIYNYDFIKEKFKAFNKKYPDIIDYDYEDDDSIIINDDDDIDDSLSDYTNENTKPETNSQANADTPINSQHKINNLSIKDDIDYKKSLPIKKTSNKFKAYINTSNRSATVIPNYTNKVIDSFSNSKKSKNIIIKTSKTKDNNIINKEGPCETLNDDETLENSVEKKSNLKNFDKCKKIIKKKQRTSSYDINCPMQVSMFPTDVSMTEINKEYKIKKGHARQTSIDYNQITTVSKYEKKRVVHKMSNQIVYYPKDKLEKNILKRPIAHQNKYCWSNRTSAVHKLNNISNNTSGDKLNK